MSSCSIDGCLGKFLARDLCEKHYRRLMNTGTVDLVRVPRVQGPCRQTGCDRQALNLGLCSAHYQRQRKGSPLDAPWKGQIVKICSVDGCESKHCAQGLCYFHYHRTHNGVAIDYEKPARGPRVHAGYVVMPLPGGKQRAEHRLVMETHIGRPLLKHENIHHINGDRGDNRIENLEIWNSSQPPGQRVLDKVAWAIELLELYAPEVLTDQATQLRLVG